MKTRILFFSIIISSLFFSSCKKDNTIADSTSTTSPTLRYEFTSDAPAAYGMHVVAGMDAVDEMINGNSWSKTLVAKKTNISGNDTTRFIVTPPDAWMGTTNSANITMKIFKNNVEVASKSTVLVWLDRPNFQIIAGY